MKVRCKSNKDLEFSLTVGKEYELIEEKNNNIYLLVDDTNEQYWFPKQYFDKRNLDNCSN